MLWNFVDVEAYLQKYTHSESPFGLGLQGNNLAEECYFTGRHDVDVVDEFPC